MVLLLAPQCGRQTTPPPTANPRQAPNQTVGPAPETNPTPTSLEQLRKNAPPFAEILKIERVRVAEPISFVVDGKERPETDLLLVLVRLRDLIPFLPRGNASNQIVLDDAPVQLLGPLASDLAVLAPVPMAPLAEIRLWTVTPRLGESEPSAQLIIEKKAESERLGPARSISLASAVQAGRADLNVHSFTNREELKRYAEGLMKTVNKK